MDLKDRERLQKLYRHIHRHTHCNQQRKGTLAAFPLNSARWRTERERSQSVCSGLIREREADRRKKDAKRSQSVFPQCSISEDEETEFVNNDMPSYNGVMLSNMLEEADERRKLRRWERNRKRVKMMLTCGAMTVLVILVTLVMVSYPTIQKMFYMKYDLIGFVILVVDKMATSNGTGLEGTAGINCTLTHLHKCRNNTHQAVG
jgi:hypothetical protein